VFETDRNNTNGIVATPQWLIVVDSFTGGLFRVDKATGAATEIPTGGASVANGDGLELRGDTLYVVRNADHLVQVFELGANLASATPIGTLTSAGLSVPTTVAFQAGRLWVVNARFGIPTNEFWVSQLPANP
jgi:Cu-Zn family superoxide dismutase